MSKFPSLQNVIDTTKKTIFKFPLETLVAFIGSFFAIILIDEKEDYLENLFTKIILSCLLCMSLFLSISLYLASRKATHWIRFILSLLLGGLVTAFVFSFSERITSTETLQFFVLAVALHLLVSFAGFIPIKNNQDEFWEFNKQLFLRIITGGIYSVVLYLGLAIAITAIKELFAVDFYDEIYAYLFVIIAGVFNTLFFLAGVPELTNSETPIFINYPKGLQKFTQYVLLPLISLYLVILICYETKIIVSLSLPVGWVSYLVLIFAIFGILSFLLILPIASKKENLWMHNFNRWFYYLLVPLLALLFWAILYRINLYGFTHERYYVLLLSIWLTVVVAYFIFKKEPKIKFIPISMCLIGLFSIVGPQSADSISLNSQLSRFEKYMIQIKSEKLTFKQEQDLSSIVSFLEENYGVEIMIPTTKNKLEKLLKKDKNPSSYQIMEALGLNYRSKYEEQKYKNKDFSYNYYENDDKIVDFISGYDLSFKINSETNLNCSECITINKKTYSFKSKIKDYGIDLEINSDVIPLKIIDFIESTEAFDSDQNRKIIQQIDSEKYEILITYINASGKRDKYMVKVDNYELKLLVKIKGK